MNNINDFTLSMLVFCIPFFMLFSLAMYLSSASFQTVTKISREEKEANDPF